VSGIQQSKVSILNFRSLFLLGRYETRRDLPKCLLWLFKPDCLDIVWFLAAKLSIQRPEYVSTERIGPWSPVTSYHILVSSVVVFLGSLKITFTYTNLTGAIWVEWLLAVFISLWVNLSCSSESIVKL